MSKKPPRCRDPRDPHRTQNKQEGEGKDSDKPCHHKLKSSCKPSRQQKRQTTYREAGGANSTCETICCTPPPPTYTHAVTHTHVHARTHTHYDFLPPGQNVSIVSQICLILV